MLSEAEFVAKYENWPRWLCEMPPEEFKQWLEDSPASYRPCSRAEYQLRTGNYNLEHLGPVELIDALSEQVEQALTRR